MAERQPSTSDVPARLRIRDAHLVGIGGSGMRALAELMRDVGVRITGSDASLRDDDRWRMHSRGLRVCAGHDAAHLPDEANVLIYSPAVPPDNPERQAARRIGIRQMSLPQAQGWLMQGRVGLCVAGTHGKTTTTALLAHLLEDAGLSPSVLCGGEMCGTGVSGRAGRGKAIVVESCEYRRHFLDHSPQHAILLNIEPDHFDCFASLDEAVDAYAAFVARIPPQGTLVVHADCSAAMQAARGASCRVITIGRRSRADWRIVSKQPKRSGWSFVVESSGRHFGRFRLPSPVKHNLTNALAAIALGHQLGIPPHRLQAGLKSFAGVRRRFEQLGESNGVTWIDDYAHHPTAIRSVLRTVRQRYGGVRIWCAFQPHQVSRTQALLTEFADSLAIADEVLIPPVFAAREQAGDEAARCSRELVRLLCAGDRRQQSADLTVRRFSESSRGRHSLPTTTTHDSESRATDGPPMSGNSRVRARFVPSLDEITQTIETEARLGDVFLTLGAGDVDSIPRDFAARLARQRAS